MRRSSRSTTLSFALLVCASCGEPQVEAPIPTASIRGIVRDEWRHTPLPGALVLDRETGVATRTDDDGRFELRVAAGTATLVVSADGFLTLERVEDAVPSSGTLDDEVGLDPASPDDAQVASRLDELAARQAQRDDPADPALRPEAAALIRAERGTPVYQIDDAPPNGTVSEHEALSGSCDVVFGTPPPTIRIWRRSVDGSTSSCAGRVDVIPFEEYLQGVLPHEWIASWPRESVRAGAVAVRTYAWRWILAGGKYACADLDDTSNSQVYRPDHVAASDRAVNDTAGEGIVRSGRLVSGEYSAENGDPTADGIVDSVCAGQTRRGHGRGMCQYGSARWARAGQSYTWIAAHYFPGSAIGCSGGPRSDAGVDAGPMALRDADDASDATAVEDVGAPDATRDVVASDARLGLDANTICR